MHTKLGRLARDGRSLFLAYDHGLEHGPSDFSLNSVNPDEVIHVAIKGGYTGLIAHKGVAHVCRENYSGKVPLIVKLNGRTNIPHHEPYSPIVCSVGEAAELGASAVAQTVFVGSEHEGKMFEDFRRVEEDAHNFDIPVIGFMYPHGKAVASPDSTDVVAYAARVGFELGADMVKVAYTGSPESFQWVVRSAAKASVVARGGPKQTMAEFVQRMRGALDAGAEGIAVGRNVWQSDDPLIVSKALCGLVFDDMPAEDVLKIYGSEKKQ